MKNNKTHLQRETEQKTKYLSHSAKNISSSFINLVTACIKRRKVSTFNKKIHTINSLLTACIKILLSIRELGGWTSQSLPQINTPPLVPPSKEFSSPPTLRLLHACPPLTPRQPRALADNDVPPGVTLDERGSLEGPGRAMGPRVRTQEPMLCGCGHSEASYANRVLPTAR